MRTVGLSEFNTNLTAQIGTHTDIAFICMNVSKVKKKSKVRIGNRRSLLEKNAMTYPGCSFKMIDNSKTICSKFHEISMTFNVRNCFPALSRPGKCYSKIQGHLGIF